MKFHLNLLLSLTLCWLAMMMSPVQAATRDFSEGWRFHLGDAAGVQSANFADGGWETVSLPHAARLEARVTNKSDRQQWEGICWYRKTFSLPASARNQRVWLRFEGAMNVAQFYVNGQKTAESVDGYLPVVVDLSAAARTPGPISLAVRLDNTHSQTTGPKPLPLLDFHLYHGLYRSASLTIKPPLHITDEILENKAASGGLFVTYPQVSATSATVSAQVHLRNSSAQAARFSLVNRLLDLEGKEISRLATRDLSLQAGEERALVNQLVVAAPRLWSPQTPNLYQLEVQILVNGRVTDSKRERIGIRRIAFEPGGLVINGQKMFLRGVNRHQEYPYVGNAVPANAQYRDALKIKQAGFDYVRLSHYPHSPDFMDACDELGLVTMNAIMGWQFNPGTPAFADNRVQAARQLVRRDRNRASVVTWELSLNETRMSRDFIKRLHEAGHEEFPGDQMFTCGWVDGYDIKIDARQSGSTAKYQNATFPAIVSEYGDWEYYAGNAGLNQDSWKDLKKAERSSRQERGAGEVRLLQQATNFQEAHNENLGTKAAGDGLWVMYDYNRGYAEDLESSGPMDLFRLPKFGYYLFQSQRDATETLSGIAGGPMVFAATYWNEKSPLDVRVYSNCDEVELFLNGRSLGRQKPDTGGISKHLRHAPFSFKIAAFEPGELRAVAHLGGKEAARHSVKTPGAARRLVLSADLSGKPIGTNDLVFLYARIVDENGTVVPDFTAPIKFDVTGAAQLIGDNAADAEAGIASILLKTGPVRGRVTVKATAGALSGSLDLTIR